MVVVCAALPAQADAPVGQYTASMGMVTDNKTGLMWQQTKAPEPLNWDNAKTYCTNLNLNGLGWRLPTVKELLTLVDHGKLNPSIDTSENGFPDESGDKVWSATPFAAVPSSIAWQVHFSDGSTYSDAMTLTYRVRCVR